MTVTTIEDIIKELGAIKESQRIKQYIELKKAQAENKISIKPINVLDKYKSELESKPNITGTMIDEKLRGGLPVGKSMLIFGGYGTGKSEICITMAALCPKKVIYIDTEGSFDARRLEELCNARGLDFKTVANKITLYQPQNWLEQMWLLRELPSPMDVDFGEIGLIIVDSVSKLFRGLEFTGRGELGTKIPLMREYPILLAEICGGLGASFIMTTQISKTPDAKSFMPEWTTEKPVGGDSLLHNGSYVFHVRRGEANVRIARLTDADNVPLCEVVFMITAKGIEPLPETAKAAKIEDKAEKYEQSIANALNDAGKRGRKKKSESESDAVDDEENSEEEPVEEAV